MISAILAADPGLMTGFNYWLSRDPLRIGEGYQLAHLDFLAWADKFVSSAPPGQMVILSEDYTLNAETIRKPGWRWSMEQIGCLRYFAKEHNHEFILQLVGDAKPFAKNERLRELGWYRPGKPHANDATRHLLLYFARIGWYDGRKFNPKIERPS